MRPRSIASAGPPDDVQAFSADVLASAERLATLEIARRSGAPSAKLLDDALVELEAQQRAMRGAHDELLAQVEELEEARARASDERERYRELFALAPQAYIVTNAAGVIQELNGAATRLLALTDARAARGRPLAVYVAEGERSRFYEALGSVRHARARTEIEIRLRWQATEAPASVRVACSAAEGRDRLFWIVSPPPAHAEPTPHGGDAAQRIAELERALRDRDDLLERERRARAHLERADRAKDRFIAVLSHDLRAPIHAVLGWTQLLRGEVLAKDARDRALATIERNARAQLALVEELLDLSRIVADKMRLELVPLDMSVLVSRVVEGFAPTATDRGITLACELAPAPITTFGDRKRVEQILRNLLTNALKFTPSGGAVRVELERGGASVVLRVRDTGRGIAQDLLPSIFECFRQERATSTVGLGLGLYIVRHLVELHGGTVDAESAGEGLGSTFTVRLPYHGAGDSAASEPSLVTANGALGGLRVLVVDDEEDSRELLGAVLVHSGANVIAASDAYTAMTMFESCLPDVVVSDIGLPDEDGCKLVRRFRERAPEIPVIAVSGFAAARDAARALEAGFNAHVTKPLDAASLVRTIRELVPPKDVA